MIERKIVAQRIKEFQVEEFIRQSLHNSGHSHTKIQRTPLGEKIIIHASRPGIIVGRKGQNIKKLTSTLKKRFKLENPQIEIAEVENVNLDAQVVAERIAASIERFGSSRFKGVAHRALRDVMDAGALGVEVFISGKVPSQRARTWRFYQGYLKKCGDIALTGVDSAYATAKLKAGVVGIKVRIMPPTTKRPDDIEVLDEPIEEVVEETRPAKKKAAKKPAKKTVKRSERKGDEKEKTAAAPKDSSMKQGPSPKKAPAEEKQSEKKQETDEPAFAQENPEEERKEGSEE